MLHSSGKDPAEKKKLMIKGKRIKEKGKPRQTRKMNKKQAGSLSKLP